MARIRKTAQDRKQEIVAAALRLAAELGPDRVTTQHIADAVGLTQPAIFRHFPTKADIWVAVGEQIAGSPENHRLPTPGTRPLDELTAMVSRQLTFIVGNPAVIAILFSRELHAENEALRLLFETMIQQRLDAYAALIRASRDMGALAGGADADDGAALILATIQGLAMRWSLEKRRFDLVAEGERLIFGMLERWGAKDIRLG